MLMDADIDALTDAEQAKYLENRAEQLRAEGQRDAAYACLIRSLDLYRSLNDDINTVQILIALNHYTGWVDFGDGLDIFDRKSKLAEEAIPLARRIGNQALLAWALCTFELDEALLEESLILARQCGNRKVLAIVLQRFGQFITRCGEPDRGKALLEEALAHAREANARHLTAHILMSLGYKSRKNQQRLYLEEAAALYRDIGDADTQILILMRLANIAEGQDLVCREAWIQEALELSRLRFREIEVRACLMILARITREGGDENRAITLENQAAAIVPPIEYPPINPVRIEALDAAYLTRDKQKIIAASRQLLMP